MQYWSVDTLISQLSIDHNMDVQYQICTLQSLHASVDLLAAVWLPYCTTLLWLTCSVHTPVIHAASHVDHEKRVAWLSISMHACGSIPIVMGLRLAVLGHQSSPIN